MQKLGVVLVGKMVVILLFDAHAVNERGRLKKLSDKDKEALLNDGETKLIKGFKKKDGSEFSAKLKIDENYKVTMFWDPKDE